MSSIWSWTGGKTAVVIAATTMMTSSPALSQQSSLPLYAAAPPGFQNQTMDAKIQRLCDEQDIRDLVSIYALRAAHGLSMADLFTDEGAFINRIPDTPVMEVRGRKALDQFFGALPTNGNHPIPTIHNHVISISGNEGTGVSSIEIHVGQGKQKRAGSGTYTDRYRRVDGRWKFVVREANFFNFGLLSQN